MSHMHIIVNAFLAMEDEDLVRVLSTDQLAEMRAKVEAVTQKSLGSISAPHPVALALEDFIKDNGGTISTGQLQGFYRKSSAYHTCINKDSGGLRGFCDSHNFPYEDIGNGNLTIRKPRPRLLPGPVVDEKSQSMERESSRQRRSSHSAKGPRASHGEGQVAHQRHAKRRTTRLPAAYAEEDDSHTSRTHTEEDGSHISGGGRLAHTAWPEVTPEPDDQVTGDHTATRVAVKLWGDVDKVAAVSEEDDDFPPLPVKKTELKSPPGGHTASGVAVKLYGDVDKVAAVSEEGNDFPPLPVKKTKLKSPTQILQRGKAPPEGLKLSLEPLQEETVEVENPVESRDRTSTAASTQSGSSMYDASLSGSSDHPPAESAPIKEPVDEEPPADEEEQEEDFVGQMIEELSHGDKFVVRVRQRLTTPGLASKFIAEISDLIDSRKSEDKTTIFEDLDISQNAIPREQFTDLFAVLADSQVQVERFRAFGCPTLGDEVALLLAGWLSSVASGMAPFEMHLSDCAIQTTGFLELCKAFEENQAFPPSHPRYPDKRQLPLYLRVEGNYIEKKTLQEKVDEGILMIMRKNDRPVYTTEHKVRLLVREDKSFGQRSGEPPSPENAPPPKRVNETWPVHNYKGQDKDRGKSKDKGKGKDRGKDSYSSGKGKSKGSSSMSALAESQKILAEAPWRGNSAPRERPSREPLRNPSSLGDSRGASSYGPRDRDYSDHGPRKTSSLSNMSTAPCTPVSQKAESISKTPDLCKKLRETEESSNKESSNKEEAAKKEGRRSSGSIRWSMMEG